MAMSFQETGLWNRTLAPRAADEPHEAERERLRNAFLTMRRNTSELLKLIPEDCKGITVHDITHVDALWEMADMIAGDGLPLNPLEAFIFGASVLLHDAGLSVASYPNGLDDLNKTIEWVDIAASVLRRNRVDNVSQAMMKDPPQEYKAEILFNVLRALHAKHAEELASVTWSTADGKHQLCLLEDMHLSHAHSRSIGQIAHSHNWNIEELSQRLRRAPVGPGTELPPSWTIDEIKIACLLRCSDAAHIDHRRAPSLLYSLTRPQGISKVHWNFQNKLNKPSKNGDVLIYSSGQDFSIDEADAWWLCYDAVKTVDRELSSSNALLEDLGKDRFEARRVFGSESPSFLAEHIRPIGWQPVNAEIRVSDPIQLAETLGGRNLYGPGAFAPLRELLQNAVDAVRARRKHEERPSNWGRVRLILEEVAGGINKENWLHVDDTGIGMSERVLVGPLLDFGRSFWNSPGLREEFPGLERQGIDPIGKFGIGFFSVFLLGRNVKVISRRYDQGLGDTRVLTFSSIASRPIIRPAGPHELPADYSTRISVRIDDPSLFEPAVHVRDRSRQLYFDYRPPRPTSVFDWVRNLIVATDVEVEISDQIHNSSYVHHANWTSCPADEFLNELLAVETAGQRRILVEGHSKLLSILEGHDGRVYGRAAMRMFDIESNAVPSGISVGGFVYSQGANQLASRTVEMADRVLNRTVGVFSGSSDDVSRSTARFEVPGEVIEKWASDQADRIEQRKYDLFDLIRVCHEIIRFGGDPKELPFAFCGGVFISLEQLKKTIERLTTILIPINKKYDEGFEMLSISGLQATFFVSKLSESVISVEASGTHEIISAEVGREASNNTPAVIAIADLKIHALSGTGLFIEQLRRTWSGEPKFVIDMRELLAERTFGRTTGRWVLICERQ
jgi:hypothetical protein